MAIVVPICLDDRKSDILLKIGAKSKTLIIVC